MSNENISDRVPPRTGRIPGTPIPHDQCPSCHFISAAVPMGFGLAAYWYGLTYWQAKERLYPRQKIWVPYTVKKPLLAVGSFTLVGYGMYRLFWKQPGTPGLF